MPSPLLSNKQLLLAKVEGTFNTDATPDSTLDAIQCEEPDFQTDFVTLERNFIKPNWSRTAHATGRKLAKITFMTEVKNGGTAGTQSKLGRLLTACSLKENAFSSAVTGTATAGSATSITLASGASAVHNAYVGLECEITSGTGSGSTGIITAYNGTTKVATVASWSSTSPAASSQYSIEPGVTYTPSSVPADHKSLTIYLYKDGILHKMTGCYGTVSFEMAVNGYGKASFEFIGQYYAPTDSALPTSYTFETTVPVQVEEMGFTINGFAAVISKLALDMGVEVLPRLDANGSDGYNGTYINDRKPTGGIDPEMALVADEAFWTRMSASTEMVVTGQVGDAAGNTVKFRAPKAQYTGMTYSSRDRITTLDAALAFNDGGLGDDEVVFTFL